jgi:hypothetical protein
MITEKQNDSTESLKMIRDSNSKEAKEEAVTRKIELTN